MTIIPLKNIRFKKVIITLIIHILSKINLVTTLTKETTITVTLKISIILTIKSDRIQ
jgi:hypothetical protein